MNPYLVFLLLLLLLLLLLYFLFGWREERVSWAPGNHLDRPFCFFGFFFVLFPKPSDSLSRPPNDFGAPSPHILRFPFNFPQGNKPETSIKFFVHSPARPSHFLRFPRLPLVLALARRPTSLSTTTTHTNLTTRDYTRSHLGNIFITSIPIGLPKLETCFFWEKICGHLAMRMVSSRTELNPLSHV